MDFFAITTQEVMEKISRHCPQAMSAYLQCINRADDEGHVLFTRQMVDVAMSENFDEFLQHIKSLAREDLLNWVPVNEGLSVTVANFWDQDE